MRQDIYRTITDRIIADLEKGVRPWAKLWSAGHLDGRIVRPLRANGEPYRGINTLMLWSEASEKGYGSPFWMTFRQALELGAHVRMGEKGSLVVYTSTISRTETDEAGKENEREIPFLKGYTVFNAEQVNDLPERFKVPVAQVLDPVQRIDSAERFVAATSAEVRHRGGRAYYSLTDDHVGMPPFEAFRDPESYYAVLTHELTHWTGHTTRLDRVFGRKRNSARYAAEELVAELGSAFLCADLGLTPEIREDHAAYVATWLTILRDDKRAIVTAAAHAQRAADYLHSLQPVTLANAA